LFYACVRRRHDISDRCALHYYPNGNLHAVRNEKIAHADISSELVTFNINVKNLSV